MISGDQVTLLIPEATLSLAGVTPRLRRLEVAGIFEVGAQLDNQLAFVEVSDASRLFKLGDGVSALRLQFENLFDAPLLTRQIAQEVSTSAGSTYSLPRLDTDPRELVRGYSIGETMIALLLTLIIAVAAFNIVSTLIMVVTDKRADIAILKTIGLSPSGVMGVFIVQGTLVGLAGTIFGVILGIPLALSITEILAFLESVFWFLSV